MALSADGICVVMHDDTLDRTTDLLGNVWDQSYAGLREADAGSWFSEEHAGELVPSLGLALTECDSLGLWVNIEIKTTERATATVSAVLAVLEGDAAWDTNRVLISSFDVRVLLALQASETKFTTGLLIDLADDSEPPGGPNRSAAWAARAQRLGARVLGISNRGLSLDELRRTADQLDQVLVFTVNELERAQALLAAGATGVFSDDLDALGSLLSKHVGGFGGMG